MKNHLSKLGLGLCAASMLLCSSAFAFRDIDDRLDALETAMQEISARNPQGTLGAEFRTSRPENEGTPWYLTFDVIYWHPKMGGTEYAITYSPKGYLDDPENIPYGVFATDHRPEGEMKENGFSWDLGLKAGIGYKTPHDDWDVYSRYTWFESHSTSQVQKDFPSAIIALKIPITSSIKFDFIGIGDKSVVIYANHAKSTVDIDYNNIDLELARSYFSSGKVSVRPYISLKGTLLDLSQKVLYVQKTSTTLGNFLAPLTSPELKVSLSSKFKGLGPRMGCDARYFLGDRFNLFGEFAASVLYGMFKLKQHDLIPELSTAGVTSPQPVGLLFSAPSRRLTNKFHSFLPFVQMQLGLEWSTYLNKNKQHLGLKIGYEVQYYWRANKMEDTKDAFNSSITEVIGDTITTIALRGRHSNDIISEDLMFYGITGQARLDF
ncbi:MAG: MOMP family protein [Chlamydiales bacterium]|nr:MOMP family protein [Chlamydiales bacterium]